MRIRGRIDVALLALLAGACATAAPPASRAASAFADADSSRVASPAPGVSHTFVHDTRGPWAMHIVEVDVTRCEPILAARKPRPPLSARATTSALADGAIATINADFFMLPGGTPVGAHVSAAVPLIGPTDRPVFATTTHGWHIGLAQTHGLAHVRGDTARIVQVNRAAAAFSAYRGTGAGLTLFTAWVGDSVPADSTASIVIAGVLAGDAGGGRGVVARIHPGTSAIALPAEHVALAARGDARAWAHRRTQGDTVSWTARVTVDDGTVAHEVVGGFPVLLRDGANVLGEVDVREDFGARRHPRTAIGWTADGRVLLVVVDGRQPAWSDGMSLDELTWLFQRLGAAHALNLDGGGSTAMVLNGRVVNRPSDREGERAVGNALALTACPERASRDP
jgi:hypothetical protein